MRVEPEDQSAEASTSNTPPESLPTVNGNVTPPEKTQEDATDTIARLIREGRIIPAKGDPTPWPEDQPLYTTEQVDAMYAASRDDH